MIRYLWSFGNTRIVFKEKSQMKSGGGLLFTAWLLLMAWCLFSNRVSTATVVGNGYLQVVTCKYLIFCSLDKYKLLVPHEVCAFAQKRLIELKSTLVGGTRGLVNFRPRSAELPPLLSHHWSSSSHAFLYKLLGLGSNLLGEPPMGLPVPVPPVLTKGYIHARTHFAKKGIFFNRKRKFPKSRKRDSFYFYFWKTEFPQFNYPRWWYDIHSQVIDS